MIMGDPAHHARMAREKREGALQEYQSGRFTNVGDLAFRAVEQAIEVAASLEGVHFHSRPRTAHAERDRWARDVFPGIALDLNVLRGAYGDLGYDGLNGRRAREALEAMERILGEIEKRSGVRLR